MEKSMPIKSLNDFMKLTKSIGGQVRHTTQVEQQAKVSRTYLAGEKLFGLMTQLRQ
jgi:hypothetical protein